MNKKMNPKCFRVITNCAISKAIGHLVLLFRDGARLTWSLAWPYKSLNHYLRFLEWNETLIKKCSVTQKPEEKEGKFKESSRNLARHRHRRVHCSAWLGVTLLLYHCLALPHHWFFNSNGNGFTGNLNDPYDHYRHLVVWADVCTLIGQVPQFNLCLAALSLMVLYFQYRLLWRPNQQEMWTLLRSFLVIDEPDNQSLHRQRNNPINPFSDLSQSPRSQQRSERKLRLVMFALLNALQVFTIFIDITILYGLWYLMTNVFFEQNHNHNSQHPLIQWSVIDLILSACTWTALIALALVITYVLTMAASIALSLVVYLRLRCRAHYRVLERIVSQRNDFINRILSQCHWTHGHCRTLRLMAQVNSLFGQLFAVFLAFSYPISAYSIMLTVTGRVRNLVGVLTLVTTFGHELFCILVIHFYAARLSRALHRPAKLLLGLNAGMIIAVVGCLKPKGSPLKGRLRLAHLVQALHCTGRRRYGFTYGTIGLVTMGSFAKAILFYCETLGYAYKMITDR